MRRWIPWFVLLALVGCGGDIADADDRDAAADAPFSLCGPGRTLCSGHANPGGFRGFVCVDGGTCPK